MEEESLKVRRANWCSRGTRGRGWKDLIVDKCLCSRDVGCVREGKSWDIVDRDTRLGMKMVEGAGEAGEGRVASGARAQL